MGLQQQRSCVRPDGVPALEDTRLDTTSQQRAILQERSANWPRDFNNQGTSSLKWSRSPSPLDNVYRRRPAPTGSYFTGNVHAHHVGLAGFSAERSEKQIDADLKRLYCMLQHSDKYQKYREKQPVMTVAEVLAKEAKELAEKLARERAAKEAGVPPPKENKDLTVWPEFLEQAFWRGTSTVSRQYCAPGAILAASGCVVCLFLHIPARDMTNSTTQHSSDGHLWVARSICWTVLFAVGMSSYKIPFEGTRG
jgi:transcriptional enhancer factor